MKTQRLFSVNAAGFFLLLSLAPIAILPAVSAAPSAGTPTGASTARTAAQEIVRHYDFNQGDCGWRAGFADYTRGKEDLFELEAGIHPLPAKLGSGHGFYLQGHNRSDDLIMFLTRRLGRAEGIKPGQKYRLYYSLQLASDAPSGCAGIGGAPGESVHLKAGGASIAPRAVGSAQDRNFLRLNVDFGEQSQSGTAASVIGNIANDTPCTGDPAARPFASFPREGSHDVTVRANARGELYLIVGTDSGYEGRTRLYYQRIQITLTPE